MPENKVQITIEALNKSKEAMAQLINDLKGVDSGAKNVNQSSQGLTGSLSSLKGMITSVASAFGAWKLAGFIKSAVDAQSEIESATIRLKAMKGGSEQAAEALDFLRKTAEAVPYTFKEVVDSATTLQSFGAKMEDWIPLLSDLSAFMGMRLPEAAAALGRAYSAGAGAADIFRERGVLEIVRALAQQKYGIEDLTSVSLPKFRQIMYEAFSDPSGKIKGTAQDLMNTWKGVFSNLEDSVFNLKTSIGESLLPTLKEIVKTDLQPMIRDFGEWVKVNRDWISSGIADFVKGVRWEFEQLAGIMERLKNYKSGFQTPNEQAQALQERWVLLRKNIAEEEKAMQNRPWDQRVLGFNEASKKSIESWKKEMAEIQAKLDAMEWASLKGKTLPADAEDLALGQAQKELGKRTAPDFGKESQQEKDKLRAFELENEAKALAARGAVEQALKKQQEAEILKEADPAKRLVIQKRQAEELTAFKLKTEGEMVEKVQEIQDAADEARDTAIREKVLAQREAIQKSEEEGRESERLYFEQQQKDLDDQARAVMEAKAREVEFVRNRTIEEAYAAKELYDLTGQYAEEAYQKKKALIEQEMDDLRKAGVEAATIEKLKAGKMARTRIDLGIETPEVSFATGWKETMAEFANVSKEMYNLARDTANNISNAFEDGLFAVMKGKFSDLGKVAQNMLDGILRSIAGVLARQATSAILGSIFGMAGGPGGALGGLVTTIDWGFMHSGGIAGKEEQKRYWQIVPNLPRFHSGAGPDEIAAVLQKGEGVFTPGQMSALGLMANKGMGGGAPVNVEINVQNKTETQVKARESGMSFDGKKYIKSVILELAETDMTFRRTIGR